MSHVHSHDQTGDSDRWQEFSWKRKWWDPTASLTVYETFLPRWSMIPLASDNFTVAFYCERNESGKCHPREKPVVSHKWRCCHKNNNKIHGRRSHKSEFRESGDHGHCLVCVWLGSLPLPVAPFQVSGALLSVSDFSVFKLSLGKGDLCRNKHSVWNTLSSDWSFEFF